MSVRLLTTVQQFTRPSFLLFFEFTNNRFAKPSLFSFAVLDCQTRPALLKYKSAAFSFRCFIQRFVLDGQTLSFSLNFSFEANLQFFFRRSYPNESKPFLCDLSSTASRVSVLFVTSFSVPIRSSTKSALDLSSVSKKSIFSFSIVLCFIESHPPFSPLTAY